MTYFLPRPRRLRIETGDVSGVTWPTNAEVRARMSPGDLFGVTTAIRPREVAVQNTGKARVLWNANDGTAEFECSDFLSRASLGPFPVGSHTLRIDGDIVSIVGPVGSGDDVVRLGYFLEYSFAPLLTVQTGAFVGVKEITAQISEDVMVRLELGRIQHGVALSSDDHRQKCVEAAVTSLGAGSERLAAASLYFHHAVRLGSGAETRVPDLNTSEIILNLAKCIQVLLGESRDAVRGSCKDFGLTAGETEQCIIPILLFRDQLDGAHAAFRPVPQDMLDTMREFSSRAVQNTRALLVRVQQQLPSGNRTLAAAVPNAGRVVDRAKLVETMKNYLSVDGLKIPERWQAE